MVYELHGDLLFAGAELVVRAIVDRSHDLDLAVVDLRALAQIGSAATRLLLELRQSMRDEDKEIVFVESGAHESFARAVETTAIPPLVFDDLDTATEWCEQHLISAYRRGSLPQPAVELADQQLCQGVDAESLTHLERLFERQLYTAGGEIIRAGDEATHIFLLMSGEVTISVAQSDGSAHRLATLSAGMSFGELAAIGDSIRSADVTANGPVELLALSAAAFEHLGATRPGLQAALLRNMLKDAYQRVDLMTREVASLGKAA